MKWVVNVTPKSLYPRARDTATTVQEAGWTSGAGLYGWGKPRPYLDSIPEPSHPARSESLYRLSHPRPKKSVKSGIFS